MDGKAGGQRRRLRRGCQCRSNVRPNSCLGGRLTATTCLRESTCTSQLRTWQPSQPRSRPLTPDQPQIVRHEPEISQNETDQIWSKAVGNWAKVTECSACFPEATEKDKPARDWPKQAQFGAEAHPPNAAPIWSRPTEFGAKRVQSLVERYPKVVETAMRLTEPNLNATPML